jgi:hypothetical protein
MSWRSLGWEYVVVAGVLGIGVVIVSDLVHELNRPRPPHAGGFDARQPPTNELFSTIKDARCIDGYLFSLEPDGTFPILDKQGKVSRC